MSFDRIPFAVTEADTEFLLATAASVTYSPGVQLDNPKYHGGGLVLEVELPTLGVFGDTFDAIVQTATDEAAAAADWTDLDMRINGISGPGIHSIQITDGVYDLLRLKFDAGAGVVAAIVRTHWMADRSITLI